MTTLTLDFIFDFTCPWCFIGQVRLSRAIEKLNLTEPSLRIQLNWLPFFLDPHVPPQGYPYRTLLEEKFGDKNQADAALLNVAETGKEDNIVFAFDRITTYPDTLPAHRLCYHLQSTGASPERVKKLVQAIFSAHFQEGQNISDIETLTHIAVSCGFKQAAIETYLKSSADFEKLEKMEQAIHTQGINGVPFLIIGRVLTVSGAQPVEVFSSAILQARQLKENVPHLRS